MSNVIKFESKSERLLKEVHSKFLKYEKDLEFNVEELRNVDRPTISCFISALFEVITDTEETPKFRLKAIKLLKTLVDNFLRISKEECTKLSKK